MTEQKTTEQKTRYTVWVYHRGEGWCYARTFYNETEAQMLVARAERMGKAATYEVK